MTIEAEVEGVGILEFPDGTDPEVIKATVKRVVSKGTANEPATATRLSNVEQGQQGMARLAAFGQSLGSATAATARDYLQGALGLAALPVDAAYGLYNAATGENRPNASQALDYYLNRAGVPQTENPYIRGINRSLGGAAAGIGVGSAISGASGATGGVGRVLAENPAKQAIGAVTGAISAQGASDVGAGPIGQTVAGVAGGMAGAGLARPTIANTVRRTFRGGEAGRQQVASNIETFETATGKTPSVGQATQNRRMQSAESLLSRAPGGAGVMAKDAEALARSAGDKIDEVAAQLSPKSTPEKAGRAIANAISGEGGFVEKFKATQGVLYDKLDGYIPSDRRVQLQNTLATLDKLNADIPGAPATSKLFKNARIQGIEGALKTDTGDTSVFNRPDLPEFFGERSSILSADDKALIASLYKDGALPYVALKKLRTLVGNELADAGIASDVPRSKWKSLYAALSQDLEQAAKESGPQATQAWKRANSFTAAGMRRIESISHVIDKAGGPEKIFQAAVSGTRDGATTLRSVMQSLPKEQQKVLSATVLRKLGRARPGQQDAGGNAFSTETFLTNWNSLSTEAKATLFDRYGSGFRQDMDKIAKVAENLRQGSQVFRNPSGTAQAGIQYSTIGGFIVALATGNVGTAGLIASGAGAANLSARLLTHPPFVKWLAKNSQVPMSQYPAALNQLARSNDPLLKEAASALQQSDQSGQ